MDIDRITYLDALKILKEKGDFHYERFSQLCNENNLNIEQRDSYRVLVIQLAEGKQFPSIIEQAQNFAGAAIRIAKAALHGEQIIAEEDIQDKRLAICKSCDKFNEEQFRCYLCGCYLRTKISLLTESCPISKW